jgi:hypothetical protein
MCRPEKSEDFRGFAWPKATTPPEVVDKKNSKVLADVGN